MGDMPPQPGSYGPNVCVYKAFKHLRGARCSSVVRAFAHGAMGRRIDPSWGGPIELFLVHVKEPLLLIGKSSPCGGSGFPLSLSEWSFTMSDAI